LDIGKYYVVLQNKRDNKIIKYYKKNFKAFFIGENISYNSKDTNYLSIKELQNLL